MAPSTIRIARRFLALGGRLMVDPKGRTTFGLDVDTIFSLALTHRQRLRSGRVARAARVLSWQRPEALAALIREQGTPAGGWIVWEGR